MLTQKKGDHDKASQTWSQYNDYIYGDDSSRTVAEDDMSLTVDILCRLFDNEESDYLDDVNPRLINNERKHFYYRNSEHKRKRKTPDWKTKGKIQNVFRKGLIS